MDDEKKKEEKEKRKEEREEKRAEEEEKKGKGGGVVFCLFFFLLFLFATPSLAPPPPPQLKLGLQSLLHGLESFRRRRQRRDLVSWRQHRDGLHSLHRLKSRISLLLPPGAWAP